MTNVIGMKDVTHPEYETSGAHDVIVLASCAVPDRASGEPLLSGTMGIAIAPGTLARRAYGSDRAEENFTCNYELNPAYAATLAGGDMRISGTSADGGARVVELPDRPFYLATGFLPQYRSTAAHPHPLITAFLKAAARDQP
jgi:CTP synthase (UTP-ammonia lyase)